jgi:hypothetical protein
MMCGATIVPSDEAAPTTLAVFKKSRRDTSFSFSMSSNSF